MSITSLRARLRYIGNVFKSGKGHSRARRKLAWSMTMTWMAGTLTIISIKKAALLGALDWNKCE